MKIIATVLVSVGAIFLLNNIGVIDINMIEIFSIWWPIIMIFSGLWMLLKRPQKQREENENFHSNSVNASSLMSTHTKAVPPTPMGNLMYRLWMGDAGLAKTYWMYGIFAGFAWGLVFGLLGLNPGTTETKAFMVCAGAYFFIVTVGLWRAANKYEGKLVWVFLGKLAAVLSMLQVIVIFAAAISTMFK